jgi:hypothetical protein
MRPELSREHETQGLPNSNHRRSGREKVLARRIVDGDD